MKKYLKNIISAMDLMCRIIVYFLVLTIVFDLVLVVGYFFYGWENYVAINSILVLNIAVLVDAVLVFTWYAFGDNLKERYAAQRKGETTEDEKKIFLVSLAWCQNDGILVPGETVFLRSNQDISRMSTSILLKHLERKGVLTLTGYEGIWDICPVLNEEAFYEDYPNETVIEI